MSASLQSEFDNAFRAMWDSIRAREAAAWDEGFDAGHQAARAVNPEWPEQPTNPYRIEREGQA